MSVDVSINAKPSGAADSGDPYSLLVFPFPPGHFRVHSFRAVERLSRPYAFDVTVSSPLLAEVDLERLALGQSAVFVLRVAAAPRAIHGVVASVRTEGARVAVDATQHRLRIVPQVALLRHARTSRIFQDATIPEVVDSVLHGAGVATRWQLSRTYTARRYVTQYQESTLEFVERLLAEAGIFYAFAQPLSLLQKLEDMAAGALASLGPLGAAGAAVGELAGALLERETMVFGDDPSAYAPLDDGSALATAISAAATLGLPTEVSIGPVTVEAPSPVLRFYDRGGMSTVLWDKVTRLSARHAVRSSRTEFRDYDPDRPQFALFATAPNATSGASLGVSVGGMSVSASVDVTANPTQGLSASVDISGVDLSGTVRQLDLEAYEHHSNFHYPDFADVQTEAARILLARRRRAEVSDGESRCPAMSPGYRFTLDEHPLSAFNREYVVTRVRHRGAVGAATEFYENDFDCVRSDVLYPPKKRPHPHVQAALTATVVGPVGEEIWVDAAGRIKVHFHWDREGSLDGQSSCWIRSMQAWGGVGFGTQFIPRVGMEVVVVFDGGDPDKPLVLGSVYNGTHPVPFALPGNKTQSGIRTQSVGAGGCNELMFEDAAGKERIYVHAQRDLEEVVENDHSLVVHQDEAVNVGANRRDTVAKDAAYEVRGNRDDIVRGDASVHHFGARIDVVEKALDQRVSGVRTIRVEDRDELDVRGTAEYRFAADFTTRVTGNQTIVVGKHDAPRSMTIRVEGVGTLSTEDTLELVSNKGITLRCGTTSLRIGADGIELQGATVRTTGDKGGLEVGKHGLKLKSNNVYAILGDQLVMKTDKASLSMRSEVKLDGSKILLNSPDRATEKPPPEPNPPTEIELKDSDGNPLGSQRFIIELEDGSQRTGVTDKDGKATMELPSGGKIRFPELTDVKSS